MTGRSNRPIGHRDLKPANLVQVARHPERDSKRLHRIALILQEILDTAVTPGEGGKL